MRGYAGGKKGDHAVAQDLLQGIFSNVTVMDRTARDSIKNFESGSGDVAITYENKVLTAQEAGLDDEMVIPPSTVLIENPVAVVDEYADEHCVREVAEAFVDFLHTKEAKDLYTTVGFLRPTDLKAAQRGGEGFPAVEDLWTVDELGGWDEINADLFSEQGLFTEALEAAQG
jgi:ABC-type sulfate transport system substrate-binding protein